MYYWRVLLLLLDCVDVCWYFADGFDVCIYIYMLYLKYCAVGDHFGFQVGFLKQYFLWVGLYVYDWIVGFNI